MTQSTRARSRCWPKAVGFIIGVAACAPGTHVPDEVTHSPISRSASQASTSRSSTAEESSEPAPQDGGYTPTVYAAGEADASSGTPPRQSLSDRGSWFQSIVLGESLPHVDTYKWLDAHDVGRDKMPIWDCHTVGQLGVPLRDGILCTQKTDPLKLKDGRSLFVGHMYVADKGELLEVFRGPVGTGAMDAMTCCGLGFYVKLNPLFSQDGRVMTLVDDATISCASNKALFDAYPDKFTIQDLRLNQIPCAARGTYVWHNGRYVRSRQGMKPSKSSGP